MKKILIFAALSLATTFGMQQNQQTDQKVAINMLNNFYACLRNSSCLFFPTGDLKNDLRNAQISFLKNFSDYICKKSLKNKNILKELIVEKNFHLHPIFLYLSVFRKKT